MGDITQETIKGEDVKRVQNWALAEGLSWDELGKIAEGPSCETKTEVWQKKFLYRKAGEAKEKSNFVGTVIVATKEQIADRLCWKIGGTWFHKQGIDTREEKSLAFLESETFLGAKFLEQFPNDSFGVTSQGFNGSGLGLNPNSEFIQLLGGPFSKQLYQYDYLLMHALCFESKNHNPLSKQAIDIITNYSLGKGMKIQFKNAEYQDHWDIYAQRTKHSQRMLSDSRQLTWAGEAMTQFVKDEQLRLKPIQIDPSTVWEIVTNPLDINEVWYYHQQFPTQFQLTYKPDDISQEYVVNDIPANEVIHTKINATSGEKRGRSDLFSVLGWLKLFKDFYTAAVVAAQIQASFVMKKKVKGNQTDVNTVRDDSGTNTVPPPFSIIVENEAVDTTFLKAEGGSLRANDNAGEALRSIIATGLGLAPEHLGVGGSSGTRATSLTKAEPASRKFEAHQQIMEQHARAEVDLWMKMSGGEIQGKTLPTTQSRPANLAGIKKALKARDWKGMIREITAIMTLGNVDEEANTDYEVIFPDISTEDRSARIKDVYTAMAFKTLSHEDASNMVAKELAYTSYDYDDTQEKLREEEQDKIVSQALQLTPPWGAAKTGPGGPASPAKPGSNASDKNYKDTATDKNTA